MRSAQFFCAWVAFCVAASEFLVTHQFTKPNNQPFFTKSIYLKHPNHLILPQLHLKILTIPTLHPPFFTKTIKTPTTTYPPQINIYLKSPPPPIFFAWGERF